MPGPLILTLRRIAVLPTGDIPPEFSAGEEGDTDNNTIEITFTLDVFSPTTDYLSGFALTQNAVPMTITAGDRQTDHSIIHLTVTEDVDIDDDIDVSYDDDLGDIEAESDGTDMADIASSQTTNYVGSHHYHDEEWASGHLAHL